jgi:hypothetical protein
VVLIVLAVAHSSSKGAARVAATASGGPTAGEIAPIALTSVDGSPVRLPVARPGALLFAASGCSSCAPSAAALGKLKEQLRTRIDAAFISVEPADPPAAVKALRHVVGDPPYPFAVDTGGTLAQQYQVSALGTAIVYDAHGRAVARLIDPDIGQLEAAFRRVGVT